MKKVWLYMFVASIALSAEPLGTAFGGGGGVSQPNPPKSGWFFGVGFGLVQHKIDVGQYGVSGVLTGTQFSGSSIGGTFVAKVGGYHYFDPKTRMGLRYYYSLDASAPSYNRVNASLTSNTEDERRFFPSLTHLLNIDMSVLLYEIQNNKFDFILGAGVGLRWGAGEFGSRARLLELAGNSDRSNHVQRTLSFEGAINIGLRWMKEKYGIELMTKVPITADTISRNPHYFYRLNNTALLKPRFNFTLNFTAEL